MSSYKAKIDKIKVTGLLSALFIFTLSCISKKEKRDVHTVESHLADTPALTVPETPAVKSYTNQDAAKDLKETFKEYQKASEQLDRSEKTDQHKQMDTVAENIKTLDDSQLAERLQPEVIEIISGAVEPDLSKKEVSSDMVDPGPDGSSETIKQDIAGIQDSNENAKSQQDAEILQSETGKGNLGQVPFEDASYAREAFLLAGGITLITIAGISAVAWKRFNDQISNFNTKMIDINSVSLPENSTLTSLETGYKRESKLLEELSQPKRAFLDKLDELLEFMNSSKYHLIGVPLSTDKYSRYLNTTDIQKFKELVEINGSNRHMVLEQLKKRSINWDAISKGMGQDIDFSLPSKKMKSQTETFTNAKQLYMVALKEDQNKLLVLKEKAVLTNDVLSQKMSQLADKKLIAKATIGVGIVAGAALAVTAGVLAYQKNKTNSSDSLRLTGENSKSDPLVDLYQRISQISRKLQSD